MKKAFDRPCRKRSRARGGLNAPPDPPRWATGREESGRQAVEKALPCAALRAALTDEPALPRVSLWPLRGHEGAWIVKKAFPCAALRAALTDEPALPRVSLWPLRGHEGAWT